MLWTTEDRVHLEVKVDKEGLLGKIHEIEKQLEVMQRTVSSLKNDISVTEEPADKQAQDLL
jgi:hypothetical protein